LRDKGKPVPEGDEDGLHRKTELALACIAAIKPDMYDVEAAACINKAFIMENPDCYKDLLVDPEALGDVLTSVEAKKMAEYTATVETVKVTQKLVLHTREKLIHKYFKKSPAPKYTPAQKKQPRWLPKKNEKSTAAITDWIKVHAPSDAAVVCDDYNGRWRVISPNLDWKSISWTKRGFEKAAFEVLHQAWTYHTDFTGHVAPFSLSELQSRYEDDALAH